MQLTENQKKQIFEKGFIKIPSVVPEKRINTALRHINYSIGKGIHPGQIPVFRSTSYCPELRNHPAVADLLYKTAVWEIVQSAIGPGSVRSIGGAQIALRFPIMQTPGELHPHIDGLYSPNNQVRKGQIQSFTMLVGFFLSNIPNEFWGNFTVWPRSHRLLEKYFREQGIGALTAGFPKLEYGQPEQITGRAGDAILCHYQLAHTVVHNVSPYIRYAVFFRLAHNNHEAHRDQTFSNIWLEWLGMQQFVGQDSGVTA